MEDIGQNIQVLIFVAHKKQADRDSAPVGEGPAGAPPPLRRDRIILYALLPRIDRFDALAKIFGKNGVIVLTSEKLSAFLLNSARIGRVELVEIFVRVGHHLVDSAGRLIVSTDPFNLDILPVLLARHIPDESLYPGEVPSNMRLPLDDEINFKLLRKLLAAGPDIKHRHKEGGTFLHFAVRKEYRKLVTLLVESGAQVNAKTNCGNTPLHLALDTYGPSTEILTYLLESGADVNAPGEDDVTPFLKAIKRHGYSPFNIGLFLDKGGDVNSAAPIGSALKLAAEAAPHCLSQVLSRGPDLEKNKQAFRETLKMPGRYHSEAVKQLLGYGFKLFPEDVVDVDLLNAVLQLKDRKLFQDLLRWGAIVHRKPRSRRRNRRQRGLPPATVEQPDTMKHLLFRAMWRSDIDSMKYLLEIDDNRGNSYYGDILREVLLCHIRVATISRFLQTSDLRFCSIFDSKVLKSLEPEIHNLPEEQIDNFDAYLDELIALGHINEKKTEVKNVICRHGVIIAAAELRVNEGFSLNGQEFRKDALPDWVQESVPSELLGECISEVERLKAERVGVSNYTFYDILNFTLSESVRLLRDPIARDTLKSSNHFAASFPNYWPLIDFRLRRADYRRTLIDQGTKMLSFLSQRCKQLPYELREHIVQNLCNHELLILIDVCTLVAGKAATAATSQSQERT